MKSLVLGIVAVAVSFGVAVFSWVNRAPKIGYAETSVLMSEFTESIQAKKKFEEAQKGWDKNLKSLNDSLMATMERMKKDYERVSASEKEKMRGALQQRNDDLQRYTNAVKKMSEDKERELMEPVIKKLNSFLDLWGKEHGYDLMFGTMSGGNILQADAKLNVTSRVLKDLNEHYRDLPETKPEAAKDSAKAKGVKP